jgi:indole-3-glycerol phosphate synthase
VLLWLWWLYTSYNNNPYPDEPTVPSVFDVVHAVSAAFVKTTTTTTTTRRYNNHPYKSRSNDNQPLRPYDDTSIIISWHDIQTRRRSIVTTMAATDFPENRDDDDDVVVVGTTTTTTVPPPKPPLLPQIFAAGYSTHSTLLLALQEAVSMAVSNLPEPTTTATSTTATTTTMDNNNNNSSSTPTVIDLCIVTLSSLYDSTSNIGMMDMAVIPPTSMIPALLAAAASVHHGGVSIRNVIGCYAAGAVSSSSSSSSSSTLHTVELESVPAVSVTMAILPDTTIRTFHVTDVPEVGPTSSRKEWQRLVGIVPSSPPPSSRVNTETATTPADNNVVGSQEDAPLFWLLPSPAFGTDLDELIQGLVQNFPSAQIMGGVASSVSSLSRARVFRYSQGYHNDHDTTCFADGCVGVTIQGDVQVQSLTAQGAKPVGGIYQILKGQDATIQIIVLDERATEALKEEEGAIDNQEEEEEEEKIEEEPVDARAALAQVYAKAQIPKPVLAEANFLMRTLSDDDQAFMRRQLLVGLDQGGPIGRTASELARLAAGLGHRFTVHQVAAGGMKDGSVTLPLGSVSITPGTRLRFFVREPDFARKEVEALWTGYKKRLLSDQFAAGNASTQVATPTFTPACCFLIPTLDRGNKFFQGKQGYESKTAARMLPSIPCISGFFSNGIVGKMDGTDDPRIGVQGSASGYFLIGSKSGRPVYSHAAAAAEKAALVEEQEARDAEEHEQEAEDNERTVRTKTIASMEERAPRSEDGELVLKRREVHSGRALTVSTVEWSVAEKTAKPSSALEGYMWDKETEVDRFRERVPLSNLASQCRSSLLDPEAPKPRDWIGPIKQAAADGTFVIIPECKRSDPASGTLRRRYDLSKLVRDFTIAGAPAVSVNCDPILFGGALDHITEARKASSLAAVEHMSEDGVIAPRILASDLILYPYQLYKLRLAGADAVSLIAEALASKDVLYLTKIASSIQLQALVTVTSEVQIDRATAVPVGYLDGIIVSNRQLEDFSLNESGEQALSLLKSESLKKLRNKHGDNIVVLAEGRIGLVQRLDEEGRVSVIQYLKELKAAGALGAIVGSGLVSSTGLDTTQTLQELQGAVKITS